MEILRALIFLTLLLGEIIFLIRKLGFPSHLAPLIVILTNTLLLFFFSLINLLKVGTYFCLYFSVVLTILGIINFPKPKTENALLFTGSNLPLFVFVFLFLVGFLYTRGTLFYAWDDYSHWGVIFKYLTETLHLPINTDTVALTYPPLTALWQFLTAVSIKVGEANAYFAQMVLEFALIIAMVPAPKQKRWLIYGLTFITVLLSISFFRLLLQTLQIDTMIALLFGAGLAQLPLKGKQPFPQFLGLVLVAIALVLTKPLSPIFVFVLVASFFLYTLVTTPGYFKQKPIHENTWKLIILIAAPILVGFLWNFHVSDFKSTTDLRLTIKSSEPIAISEIYPLDTELYIKKINQDDQDLERNMILGLSDKKEISLEAVINAFTENTTYFVKTVSENFINTISEGNKLTADRIPQKYYFLFIIILIIINSYILRRFDGEKKSLHSIYNGLLILGLVLYGVALFLSYIFVFMKSEALRVPSLDRYIATYLLPFWIFNIVTLYKIANDSEEPSAKSFYQWVSISLVLGLFLYIPTGTYIHLPPSPRNKYFEVQDQYQKISSIPFTQKDKIYEVYFGIDDVGLNHYIMRYYLTPAGSNYRGWSIRVKKEPDNFTDVILSPAEWLSVLNSQKYNYVLVTQSDPKFWSDYGSLFDRFVQDPEIPQLFRVTQDKLLFVPIGGK